MSLIRLLIYIALPLLLSVTSCQRTIDDDMTDDGRLVVDGWIDSDGYPVVLLSRSLSPMNPAATDIADLVVRWAEVTISDGESTEVMIGRIDRTVTPPFMYTTAKMKGCPGKTYTITASYGGRRVTANCTMPRPAKIEDVRVAAIADSDTMREVKVCFNPTPGGHYQLCVYNPDDSGRSLPCFMGTYRAGDNPGMVTLNVCRPKTEIGYNGSRYTPYFAVGTRIMVSLTTVEPEVWNFWNRYDDVTAFGGNVFLAGTVPLEGNITGGYGIWNARGCDTRIISVE